MATLKELCREKPAKIIDKAKYGSIIFEDKKYFPPIFISHGVNHKELKGIKKCGGFIWPSCAASWKIPSFYHDIVFILDPIILVNSLPPYGKPNKNISIVEGDSMSPTVSRLLEETGDLSDIKIKAYIKMDKPYYVGPKAKNIYKAKKFLKDCIKHHTTSSRLLDDKIDKYGLPSIYRYKAIRNFETYGVPYRYPYLEIKFRGVIDINNFTAVFYPKGRSKIVQKFLKDMKFKGDKISVKTKTIDHDERRDSPDTMAWGLDMTASILEWIETKKYLSIPPK